MTPYNRIFQLHAEGFNNSQIERSIGNVTRKTIITVLQLAEKYGFEYSQTTPMTDEDIHRVLHPKKSRDARMPDLESVIYSLGLPGISVATLWKQYCRQQKASGRVPYSKTMFQNLVNEAKRSSHIPFHESLLVFHYVKNVFTDKDGNKRGILFAEMAGSNYVSMTVVPNTKARSWVHALIRIIHNYGAVPSDCCFVGHTPKDVAEMTKDYSL